MARKLGFVGRAASTFIGTVLALGVFGAIAAYFLKGWAEELKDDLVPSADTLMSEVFGGGGGMGMGGLVGEMLGGMGGMEGEGGGGLDDLFDEVEGEDDWDVGFEDDSQEDEGQ